MYTPRFSPCDFSVLPFLRVGLKLDRILDVDLHVLDSHSARLLLLGLGRFLSTESRILWNVLRDEGKYVQFLHWLDQKPDDLGCLLVFG